MKIKPLFALLLLLSFSRPVVGQGHVLAIVNGGTGASTQQTALDALACSPTRAGDVMVYNGTHWVCVAGNNSGTKILQEDSSGAASWAAPGACSTCVTSAASLTSTYIMTGAGSQAAQTPSSAATVDSSGNFAGASFLASGIIDGTVPVTVTTSTPITVGATYRSGYFDNQHATAGTAITYNLPTAAAGRSYCFVNSYNGSAMDTGTITIQTSASGQYIIDGALSATGGYVISGGAAGDAACVRGVDSTHWQFYTQGGTWVLH